MNVKLAMTPHDLHLVVDGTTNTAKMFDYNGLDLYEIPCLPHGVKGPGWTMQGGDTPPGTYLVGDWVPTLDTDDERTHQEYGVGYYYLIEQEGQESKEGRAGVGMHGGGTGLADPMALVQELLKTLGCIRFHNRDILKLHNSITWIRRTNGRVFVTVIQANQAAA